MSYVHSGNHRGPIYTTFGWDCEYCALWLSSYSQLTLTHSKNEKKLLRGFVIKLQY